MKRILVPIDFSQDSLNALKIGLKIANKLGAHFRVMHVRTRKVVPEYFSNKDADLQLQRGVEEWMKKVEEDFVDLYKVPNGVFDTKIREGNVVREISNQAKYSDTTMVVVGSHGASGFEDRWVGSNAYRLVSHAPVPVLTVRYNMDWEGVKSIILPIDYKKESRQKVPAVVGFAKLFGAKIHIVGLKHSHYKFLQTRVSAFVKQTQRFVEKNTDLEVETTILTGKSMADLIFNYVKENSVDVVSVRVNHSSNPFEGIFKPYANTIINGSSKPVLAIPTRE